MQDYSTVKVGDTIWWSDVNGRRSDPESGTVLKIGPKIITVSHHSRTIAFRRDTGCTNDAYGHQTLIADLGLYKAEVVADRAFGMLRMGLNVRREYGVTAADIKEAARRLKIELRDF